MLVMEPQPPLPSQALSAAQDLQHALDRHGIPTDVNDGYGLAVLSVWSGLLVWCDERLYWWRTGWAPKGRRAIYAWHSTLEPVRTAHRVALRYADLRASRTFSETEEPACR
ncbi:hypothetical protein [Nonomuraea endophytica]|uniref:Uncharacterized protein n=1 Tax=Nonomuraea endophytica TaxID=714136 RepID=A0A7W8EEK5_9ACTN|nr:hypothetical protein [Nonomuraea endophytica]MBB5075492.1 hypothetical protein [Nonomuraea endophytica]